MFSDEDGYLQIIIYAVAIVGWLISTIYKNKRKIDDAKRQEFEDETSFPDEIFDPVKEKEETAFPETNVWEEPVYEFPSADPTAIEVDIVPEPAVSELREKAKELLVDSLESDRIEQTSVKAEIDFFETEEYKGGMQIDYEGEQSNADEFDLRKAVIFSEILKPKYIDNGY